jgi:hypothetical protein
MFTDAEIVEILNGEVRSATARLKDARRIVDAIIAEGLGIRPQPDGNPRITSANKARIAASEALELALKRNVDFTLKGIVPEDLK